MTYTWEVPDDHFQHVLDLLARAQSADRMGDTVLLQELCEEIKFLPGYPLGADPTQDVIELAMVGSTRLITLPSPHLSTN